MSICSSCVLAWSELGANGRRFGWVNASYVVGLQVLDEDLRSALEDMVPYDEYKKGSG